MGGGPFFFLKPTRTKKTKMKQKHFQDEVAKLVGGRLSGFNVNVPTVKGICPKCKKVVTDKQERVKFEGLYYHKVCFRS